MVEDGVLLKSFDELRDQEGNKHEVDIVYVIE